MTLTIVSSTPAVAQNTLFYSICPVFVASNVAVELGWLDDELAAVGASSRYLGTLPNDEQRIAHFQHTLPFQIRDGGNIPPTWARARGADTVLIGATGFNSGGQIVVRADSGIYRVSELAGRRVGLPRPDTSYRASPAWWRANSEFGLNLILRLVGLKLTDLEVIDIPVNEATVTLPPAKRPSEGWPQTEREKLAFRLPEVAALGEGHVDAIFSNQGRSEVLARTGKFKVIEDLRRYPDWTLSAPSGPYLITASRKLIDEHSEIAIAFLRASIRAGRWISNNRRAAAELLHRVTYQPTVDETARDSAGIDFEPSLSPQNLETLKLLKNFLFDHGYIERDFDVDSWADHRFLDEARRGL